MEKTFEEYLRGEDGIKILLDIIERQKNPGNGPKITFLISPCEYSP